MHEDQEVSHLKSEVSRLKSNIQTIVDWVSDLRVEIEATPGSAIKDPEAWNNYIAHALKQIAESGLKKIPNEIAHHICPTCKRSYSFEFTGECYQCFDVLYYSK